MDLDGIFLDMYGTLTTGDRAAVEAICSDIIRDTGVRLSPRQLGIIWGERFFQAMDAACDDGFETLFQIEARTLRETMTELGVAVVPEPYAVRLVEYWRDPPLQPDAAEFLAGFATPICFVSNADRADIEAALERHRIHVAGLVTSEDVRAYKPDPRMFAAALRLTGWCPDRVLHVGDSLHSDVGGARLAGLASVWINRAHRIHDIGNHRPDFEFDDLLAFKSWLQSQGRRQR
jgi:2-haloacid dehalogenase/putative hydrolase of the HAD superfamily